MHCIVLVKQVPDVSNIPEDAWDREKGTLRRGLLDSVLNPLGLHALTFAKRITAGDPTAKTIYLTMGPPQARDMLIECISRAPGEAVLLTDRALGGADTVSTAYALAQGIRRIERDLFNGSRDYMIITGMQSVDGDTAQVPPQLAEDLGIDQIAYAQDIHTDGKLVIRRIGAAGTEDVEPKRFPVVVTVTACTDTLYAGFAAARAARNTGVIHTWSAADVEAKLDRVGLKGSRTTVYRIFSPSEDRAKQCEMVPDAAELMRKLKAKYRLATGGPAHNEEGAYSLDGKEPTYKGELWVLAEREGDGVKSVSLELLGKTVELAAFLGERVGVVLPTDHAGDLPAELIAHGADVVYAIEHPMLATFAPLPFKPAVAGLVNERHPQVMLFGATPMGRELAPRIAYACDSGLTADCTKLEIGDHTKGGNALVGILKQTRPALGGNIMATIMTKDSPTQMATVRPGVFKVPTRDDARQGEVVRITPNLGDDLIGAEVTPVESFTSKVNIRDAKIIVSGGHGIRSRGDFDRLLQPLADSLGDMLGDGAKVAASRHAVEDGYRTHDYQVGQTGQTVAPKLYVAIGISGAVQHVSGMQMSDTVIAINKDPRARIFNYADFGIVGDLETVVPQLTRAAQEAK
ncbi:MAG: FAD-binding protein [Chloroflexota bacterium]